MNAGAARLLAAFLRLPGRRRALALEAAAWLVLACVLVRRVPMRRWRGSLNAPVAGAAAPADRLALGRDVGRMVRRVARRATLLDAACLPRAIAAQWMLRRRRVPSRLVLGVRRAPRGGPSDYHAWLTVDGGRIMGGRHAETFTPLPALVPRPPGGARLSSPAGK